MADEPQRARSERQLNEPSLRPYFMLVGIGLLVAGVIACFGLVHELPKADTPLERNGIRTATLAAIAGVGAFVTLILSARSHHLAALAHAHAQAEAIAVEARHKEDLHAARERNAEQLAAERSRADRLHLTQLFDSAAEKLGASDDATRTAAVLILERLYSDAGTLLTDGDNDTAQRDSLRRSITETLCAYVRERSTADSRNWHHQHQPAHDLRTGLHDDYRSPASIRTTIDILGRLTDLPQTVKEYDLSGSHLADVSFADATYGTTVDLSRASVGRATFSRTTFGVGARFVGATFNTDARFVRAKFEAAGRFVGTTFRADVEFTGTRFKANAQFSGATFEAAAQFAGATFEANAQFDRATFDAISRFDRARFDRNAQLIDAAFNGKTSFLESQFHAHALFDRARFRNVPDFTGATFAHPQDDPRNKQQR